MTEVETVALLSGLLEAREPFLHVRFGDGDVFFATGTGPKLTGDGEEWTPELAARLRQAWRTLARHPGRLLVGDVESYAVSDGCEPQWRELVKEAALIRGSTLELVHMEALRVSFGVAVPFYRAISEDPRRKILVAPEQLAAAATMLNADHFHVPLRTAHVRAAGTAAMVLRERPDVVLFAAGRGGKIMQADVSAADPGITQVDIGSGLDILFTNLRRGTDSGADERALRAEYRAAGLL